MRLALVEDRTVLRRIASKSESPFSYPPFLGKTKTKSLAACFLTSEAFSLREKCAILFSLKR